MILSKAELLGAICVLIGIIGILALAIFYEAREPDCVSIDADRIDRLERLAHPPPSG